MTDQTTIEELILYSQRTAFDLRGLAEDSEPLNGLDLQAADLLDKCASTLDRTEASRRELIEERDQLRAELAEMKAKFAAALETVAKGGLVHVNLFERNVELATELSTLQRALSAAEQERDQLRAQAIEDRAWRKRLEDAVVRYEADISAAEERVRELVRYVKRHAMHEDHCAWTPADEDGPATPCTCQFAALTEKEKA